jgi:hypothetical protein
MCRLHEGLGLKKTVPYLDEERVPVTELAINRGDAASSRLERNHGRRRSVVDHLEGSGAERCLIRCVVAVLHPRRPTKPALRSIPGETAEVNRDDVVGYLRLLVNTGSRSLTMDIGRPWSLTTWSKNALATVSAEYGWLRVRTCAILEKPVNNG